MTRSSKRILLLLVSLTSLLAMVGCATYTRKQAELRPELSESDFEAALVLLEGNKTGKAMLLYFLEKALVLHYADEWVASNESFQRAEDLAAELYTKSISEAAISMVTSDNSISYRADPFELAMIPYYRALNYVYLGEKEEALVEARKASLYLGQYVDAFLGGEEADEKADAGLEKTLRNDAFLQYFSGLLYEWGGEEADAFISYRHAADAYHLIGDRLAVVTPPWLGEDLVRTGRRLGFSAELEEVRRTYPGLFPPTEQPGDTIAGEAATAGMPAWAATGGDSTVIADGSLRGTAADSSGWGGLSVPLRGEQGEVASGQVVLLLESGYVAHREQRETNIPIFKGESRTDYYVWADELAVRTRDGWSDDREIDYWLRVTLPEMVSNRPEVMGARVSAGIAGGHAMAVPVEDLEGRAFITYEAEYGKILLKTIARALAKYGLKEGAEDQSEVLGILANIFGAVTESADTRSWLTLPNVITMARLSLPPGEYDLQVELVDAEGFSLGTETVPGVVVAEGDWVFLSRRIF
jgi:tetratricopeptide (TPR) repeat protein